MPASHFVSAEAGSQGAEAGDHDCAMRAGVWQAAPMFAPRRTVTCECFSGGGHYPPQVGDNMHGGRRYYRQR